MKKTQQKFATMDLYITSYLSLKNLSPSLTNNNGRIIFEFEISNKLYSLIEEYNSNAAVPVADFVGQLKIMRSQMLTVRGDRKCTL